MPNRILFLCTGNYYRSRFAEEFFNHHAARHRLDWVADSRGLALERGSFNIGPISHYTLEALKARGIRLREPLRMPKALCDEDLKQADRVIALKETEHRPLMREQFADWCDRVDYWEVHDLDGSTPAEAMGEIERRLTLMIDSLIGEEDDSG